MKQKNKLELYLHNQHAKKRENQNHPQQKQLVEIHKAVAQALHSHFNNNKAKLATTSHEFDPPRTRNFRSKPSRFKLEASKKVEDKEEETKGKIWDFTQSLWDPYEITAVSKRLEMGLVLGYDHHFHGLQRVDHENRRVYKKRKEGKISLWNLFNKMSTRRRFSDVGVYGGEDKEDDHLGVYFCSPFML